MTMFLKTPIEFFDVFLNIDNEIIILFYALVLKRQLEAYGTPIICLSVCSIVRLSVIPPHLH